MATTIPNKTPIWKRLIISSLISMPVAGFTYCIMNKFKRRNKKLRIISSIVGGIASFGVTYYIGSRPEINTKLS